MRALTLAAALALTAFAQTAAAATVTIGPVAFSPEFAEELRDDLGEREGLYLQNEVSRKVAEALTSAGAQLGPGGELSVELTIVDADPSKPTFEQLRQRVGLDYGRSVSLGGADLAAVIRASDGQVLAEVQHDYRPPELFDPAPPLTTWEDANRAIRGFARKVADAYSANAR